MTKSTLDAMKNVAPSLAVASLLAFTFIQTAMSWLLAFPFIQTA